MTSNDTKPLLALFHELAEQLASEGIQNGDLIAFLNRRATPDERRPHLRPAYNSIMQLLAKHKLYAAFEATEPESPERIAVLAKLLVKLKSRSAEVKAETPAVVTGKRSRTAGSISNRMRKTFEDRPESKGWSASDWATYLQCSKSTVIESDAWDSLKLVKADAALKAEARPLDRRRKRRPSRN